MEEADQPEQAECEEDLHQVFCSADGDSDGLTIDYKLWQVRDSHGLDNDDDELHELIDSVDDDGDGFIS